MQQAEPALARPVELSAAWRTSSSLASALLLDQRGCLVASPKASAFGVRVLFELRTAG
jgi:hypothetical protein